MAELTDESIAAIVAHMNDDHGDSVADYARHYGDMERVDSATLLGFDTEAMRISAMADGVQSVIIVDFDHELTDTDDARQMLIAMAKTAAAR